MHLFTLLKVLSLFAPPVVPNYLSNEEGYDLATFPDPESPSCLTRPDVQDGLICDPNRWLSKEAHISVHRLFVSSKMQLIHCFHRRNRLPCVQGNSSHPNPTDLQSAHFVMADKVSLVNVSLCDKSATQPLEDKNVEVEEIAYKELMRFSTSLLNKWNGRGCPACTVDILLMMVKEMVLCDRGTRLTLRNHRRPTLVVAIRGEDEGLFFGALKRLADENNRDISLSSIPQRVEKALLALEPVLRALRQFRRSNIPRELCPSVGRPNHNIPTWATTTILVCLLLIVICTFVGYLVNNRSQTLQICDPNPFSLIDFTRRKRKWRAGFGGGLI
uniref:Uncharacterized protein n=1 Tax=Trichuris muris TaxID=70415 RepID=A0A5S6QTJ9_TRIMR